MFTVKAGYSDDIEVKSSIDKVREFFTDMNNFADLMPGIASIRMQRASLIGRSKPKFHTSDR